ncbi:MAG: hypothetical protein K8J08_01700 [Thermoanaerobaculia bacterium]|nr:hypothetical protein [Thermoanaerobaculia bacterium]
MTLARFAKWASAVAALVLTGSATMAFDAPQDNNKSELSGIQSDSRLDVAPSLTRHEMGASSAAEVPALQSFLNRNGVSWEVRWDERNDRPHLIQGEGIPLIPGRGNRLSRADVGIAAADGDIDLDGVAGLLQSFIADNQELLRVSLSDLRLDRERSLVYGENDYLWMVEFQQVHNGVAVEGANVFFRINHGNIVQFGVDRVADVRIDTRPTIERAAAFNRVLRHSGVRGNALAEVLDRGTLRIYPVARDGEAPGQPFVGTRADGYDHLLVWSFEFRRSGDDATYGALVDARTGEVLRLRDENRTADVTAGIYPVTNTDPEEVRGLPSCSVTNSGTKITDANGSYIYSGGTATSTLNGRYVRISDNCGSISLSSSDGNLNFGSSGGTDCTTPGFGGAGNTHSARSGFYHLTNINRKAASFFPGNSWLNGTLTANMNINNNCNAFWNGSSVNFYTSGGGCNNTGEIAGVFLHEWGHGMDTNSGGAASDRASGEAVGDTFAFLETRDSCIGDNFTANVCNNCDVGSCTGVRDMASYAIGGPHVARPNTVELNSGLNCDRAFNSCSSCPCSAYQGIMGYEGHCESYIASTANWDLAQMLVAEHGTTAGWAAMDAIWYGSLTPSKSAYRVASGGLCNPSATVDGCGSTNWYTVFLPADDDDGNLANGTPNACRIWDAFDAHGIACGARPQCSTTCTPAPVADAGPDQTICLGDSAAIGTGALGGHTYSWSPGGQTAAQISVSPSTSTSYTVTATTSCSSAQDSVLVTVDSGTGGGLSDDFEGGVGGWTTSGLWHLTSNSSCASPGYSSPTNAFYYGQDSTCNYASGTNSGNLISPSIGGITASSTLSFDFYRQVENYTAGSFDQADVSVSVAGSGAWTSVWSRDSTNTSLATWTSSGGISLASFAGSNIQVRFRFNTVDGTANNFTGWFIDDVVVTGDSPCGPGNTAPAVTITAPSDPTTITVGDSINFTGTASDTEDGSLTASIAWTSSLDGALGTGGSVSTSGLSVGSHVVTASVTDSGSLTATDTVNVTVNPPGNTAPTVNITAPAGPVTVDQGTTVNFAGTASDAEDGDLTSSLAWSSSLDGSIGSGGSFATSTLSVGVHTVTASVSDSGSLSGSDSVSVTVNSVGGCVDCINWNVTGTVSYSNQDTSGNVTVESADTILLEDNTWRRTTQTFAITANTVLEFEFQSTSQGEIHGIGFDEDDTLTNNVRIFQLHGTQNWTSANHDFDNYSGTAFTTYSIPVGQYYTGTMFLVLTNDNDAGSGNTSRFRNVRVFDEVSNCTAEVNFQGGAAGWTNDASSTCSTGSFVIGTPTQVINGGVTTQLAGDHTTGSGNAFFSAVNTSAGVNDVDGGTCVVLSPVYPVSQASNVSVWWYHGQRDAGDDAGDFFSLEISTNGGTSWSTMASRGDVTSNAAWTQATATAAAGTNVRFRLRVADGTAGGDLIEAGLDDVSICNQ